MRLITVDDTAIKHLAVCSNVGGILEPLLLVGLGSTFGVELALWS